LCPLCERRWNVKQKRRSACGIDACISDGAAGRMQPRQCTCDWISCARQTLHRPWPQGSSVQSPSQVRHTGHSMLLRGSGNGDTSLLICSAAFTGSPAGYKNIVNIKDGVMCRHCAQQSRSDVHAAVCHIIKQGQVLCPQLEMPSTCAAQHSAAASNSFVPSEQAAAASTAEGQPPWERGCALVASVGGSWRCRHA